jgi:hypothetical protein
MSARETRPKTALPAVLTTRDLVATLHIGENHVRKLVADGELHRLAYSPRIILVSRKEVLGFVERQSVASVPPPQ